MMQKVWYKFFYYLLTLLQDKLDDTNKRKLLHIFDTEKGESFGEFLFYVTLSGTFYVRQTAATIKLIFGAGRPSKETRTSCIVQPNTAGGETHTKWCGVVKYNPQ